MVSCRDNRLGGAVALNRALDKVSWNGRVAAATITAVKKRAHRLSHTSGPLFMNERPHSGCVRNSIFVYICLFVCSVSIQVSSGDSLHLYSNQFSINWQAVDGDTLQHYLSKSQMVAIARVSSEPIRLVSPEPLGDSELRAVRYKLSATVVEGLYGSVLQGGTLDVWFYSYEPHSYSASIPKQGETYLFFLVRRDSPDPNVWYTADTWYGIQRPEPGLVTRLRLLLSDGAERQKVDSGSPMKSESTPDPTKP